MKSGLGFYGKLLVDDVDLYIKTPTCLMRYRDLLSALIFFQFCFEPCHRLVHGRAADQRINKEAKPKCHKRIQFYRHGSLYQDTFVFLCKCENMRNFSKV